MGIINPTSQACEVWCEPWCAQDFSQETAYRGRREKHILLLKALRPPHLVLTLGFLPSSFLCPPCYSALSPSNSSLPPPLQLCSSPACGQPLDRGSRAGQVWVGTPNALRTLGLSPKPVGRRSARAGCCQACTSRGSGLPGGH
jgi:hypothetical protein